MVSRPACPITNASNIGYYCMLDLWFIVSGFAKCIPSNLMTSLDYCHLSIYWLCEVLAITGITALLPSHYCPVTVTQLRCPSIFQILNELHWLGSIIGHHTISPGNDHQGTIYHFIINAGTNVVFYGCQTMGRITQGDVICGGCTTQWRCLT